MTNLRIALATAAPMLLWAALALPADAATRTVGGAQAHRTHARGAHGNRGACGARATRNARCRTSAKRTSARTPRPRRPRSAAKLESTTSQSQVAAAQAASIAQVLATPCQNTNLTPTSTNLPLVRAAVLCLINTERAQNGEEPLQANRHLEAAAESHGREMIAVNYFDHVSPSGVTPVDRVREAGYFPSPEVGYVVGENLAWGTLSLSTPEAIVNAWIASPEHLANILEAKYRETGIDVQPEVPRSLAEGVEGGLYTQEFGVIIR